MANTLLVMDTGMVAAFVNGQQVPELQCDSMFALWAAKAESLGYDPTNFLIETRSGNWRMEKRPEDADTIGNGWRAVQA